MHVNDMSVAVQVFCEVDMTSLDSNQQPNAQATRLNTLSLHSGIPVTLSRLMAALTLGSLMHRVEVPVLRQQGQTLEQVSH